MSGSVEAGRALGVTSLPSVATATPSADAKTRLVQFSQQGQFIAGKNFYQNHTQWVDATAQKFPSAKRQVIQFNSPEYFEFAAKEPRALPYLSLGRNVQFVLDDKLYEVRE